MNPANITFNLHHNHNPDCDILSYQLDDDTSVTYGRYVKKPENSKRHINEGDEFLEVYSGSNYNKYSVKRSYSRVYYRTTDKFPEKYEVLWLKLKDFYFNMKTIDFVASKFK
jgi:hypothetical protein